MTPNVFRWLAPLLVLCTQLAAQTPVSLGKGSYASFPPPQAGAGVDSFERLSRLDVRAGETRAIPTNDWWSDVLVSAFAGDLWAHPLVADPDANGVRVWFPTEQAPDGNGMVRGDPVRISGVGFTPSRDIARDWGDWHVVVREEAGASHLDMTLARGVPVVWFEATGFQPRLELPGGMVPRTAAGAAITAAVALDRLVLVKGEKAVGVYLPAGTNVSYLDGIVNLAFPTGATWLSLAALPSVGDVDAWQAWSTVVPRSTRLSWQRAAPSRMRATYAVTGQDLSGSGRTAVLQTFPPHAWRDAVEAPAWRAETFRSPRGTLKAALGTSFAFAWDMPGILPDYGAADADPTGTPNPWNRGVQDALVTGYAAKATYGADTYWGGKDLVLLAKHAVFASRTGHPEAKAILAKAESALADWLTWTPGETAHYFAWYPRWKALVGFQESYGSSQFTDNHFHYGYLIHAAALVGTLDPAFLADYGPMLRKVAAQFANGDRSDSSLPFLRTFEPWTGHSYAGGTSAPGGNNQESTSEAMQSWVGVFLLGAVLGDSALRDVGSFGYLMESRATLEYWFDWKGGNFAPGWAHSNVGIVFDGGLVYGTWFSGNPLHIHAIQYLPMCPGFQYLARDTAWARSEYKAMQTEAAAAEGYTDETGYGDDWANVAFSFRQLFEPGEVCRRFDVDRAAGEGWTSEANATATYAYAHANRQLGPVAWDYAYSLPSAMGFRNGTRVTHVIWNPSDAEASCTIWKSGVLVGTVRVPARSVVRHRMDAELARLEILAPGRTLPTGETTTLSAKGFDQYGASFDLGAISWTASAGTIDADGRFSLGVATDSVRIEARSGGQVASLVVRVGSPSNLASIHIRPAYVQMLVGSTVPLRVLALDQYGDPLPTTGLAWTARGPVSLSGASVTGSAPGTAWVVARSGAIADSIPVDVYTAMTEISLGATVTASSSLGANTPAKAIDHDRTTRWESTHGIDSTWFRLELDTLANLAATVIDWEPAAASKFAVDVSLDGTVWRPWTTVTGGDGGLDSLSGSGRARFVRLAMSARTTTYGYSIFETRLWGFPLTEYSARLDADTLPWPTTAIQRDPRASSTREWRNVRIAGHDLRILLPPEAKVLSSRLVDLRGRDLSGTLPAGTLAIALLQTDRGPVTHRLLLPSR